MYSRGLFDNLTPTQIVARRNIKRIEGKMRSAWDKEYLGQLYEQAMNVWWEYFPFQADQLDDKLSTIRLYNDLLKDLKDAHSITINMFGCNVTINTATS